MNDLPRVTYSNTGEDFSGVHAHLDAIIPDVEARLLGKARLAHIGGRDRNVGSASDGDTDVGACERGCVVDAVSHHGNDTTAAARLGDDARFFFRSYLGENLCNAELLRYRFGRASAVAGHHRYLDT